VIVTVVGNVRVPASVVDGLPSHMPVFLTAKVTVLFSVSACVVLLHAPPGSDTAVAVIVQTTVPGAAQVPDEIVLDTKLTPLSPTTVVLPAVKVHGDDDVTQVGSVGRKL
jgi:hypothetical protein